MAGDGQGSSPKSSPRDPETGAVALEPDTAPDAGDDGDSALDVASVGSRTTSLTSSIAKYRLENGRTYHSYKEGSYVLPNDEIENERLDLQHHIAIMTQDDRLYTCPAGKDKPLHRVLDAGCGTGIWAMDFADEHPEAEVIGIDLSPIQPTFVPPNVSFYVDDLEAEWTYSSPFDFIYLRAMTGTLRDIPNLFTQAFKNLNPGGYIELFDPVYPMSCDDDTVPPDSALLKWSVLLSEAGMKLGSRLDSGLYYKDQLAGAGFVNVVETDYKWPVNTWPKDPRYKMLGAWTHENLMQGLQGLSMALFTRVLGWSAGEVEAFLIDVRKDLKNRHMHGYWRVKVVYGQKPE